MRGRGATITGWKAVVVLVALVAVGGFRVTTGHAKLDAKARSALTLWVQSEMIRPILADTTRSLAEKGAAALQASSVSVRSLAARGPLSNAVVRAELAPNPAFPPGTKLVRYYRMRYSQSSGWTLRGKATAVDWYLAAL